MKTTADRVKEKMLINAQKSNRIEIHEEAWKRMTERAALERFMFNQKRKGGTQ